MVEMDRTCVKNRDVNDGVQVPKDLCNILGFESEKCLEDFKSQILIGI